MPLPDLSQPRQISSRLKRCAAVSAWLLAAGNAASQAETGPIRTGGTFTVDVGRGPVAVFVPSSYEPGVAIPLVVMLHGYSASGALEETYLQLLPLAEQYGFIYTHPDGNVDSRGQQFWNATNACCDLDHTGVDDSGYLFALLDAIAARWTVDPWRIHFIGHSNGGFMSYRMACDHPARIAAIASLAGASWADPSDCSPAASVHILEIHGTSDFTIRYTGGSIAGEPYPGALASVQQWASFDGCKPVADTSQPPLDLDANLPGAETTVARYAAGCDAGGSAELWTIHGGGHVPNLTPDFRQLVVQFLLSHPKVGPVDSGGGLLPTQQLRAFPNPFVSTTRLQLDRPASSAATLRIVDVAGRVVRILPGLQARNASLGVFDWDGRTDSGESVPAGIYLVALIDGAQRATAKLVRTN